MTEVAWRAGGVVFLRFRRRSVGPSQAARAPGSAGAAPLVSVHDAVVVTALKLAGEIAGVEGDAVRLGLRPFQIVTVRLTPSGTV